MAARALPRSALSKLHPQALMVCTWQRLRVSRAVGVTLSTTASLGPQPTSRRVRQPDRVRVHRTSAGAGGAVARLQRWCIATVLSAVTQFVAVVARGGCPRSEDRACRGDWKVQPIQFCPLILCTAMPTVTAVAPYHPIALLLINKSVTTVQPGVMTRRNGQRCSQEPSCLMPY